MVSVLSISVLNYQPKRKLTQAIPTSHPYGIHLKTKAAVMPTTVSLVSNDNTASRGFTSLVSGFAQAVI